MASEWRKIWQNFKKKHPTFEKSKNFKSDVGPQLDKFAKADVELDKLIAELHKKADEIVAIGKSVGAALKGYQAVVNELKESDPTIVRDFDDFGDFEEKFVTQYKKLKVKPFEA
jgi:hypothetical protein